MKISREARDKYHLESDIFSDFGDVVFDGDVHRVRKFVESLNEKRDLINYPELAAKTSDLYAIGLITEIQQYVYRLYLDQIESDDLNQNLYDHLVEEFGEDTLLDTTKYLIENFPPNEIYSNQMQSEDFLELEESGVKNRINLVDDFMEVWLANVNPAFSNYLELFDDEYLEKRTKYLTIVESIHEFMGTLPKFAHTDENIIDTMRGPEKKFPHSKQKQMAFIREKWSPFLGQWNYKILIGLDLIREEEKMRGFGPGKLQGLEFEGLDIENYSPDSAWMPNVIMMAKNAYVWLNQLSKKYDTEIKFLNEIPDKELETLSNYGFTALWLIGLWERSPASKTIKNWCGNPDAVASAYSLYDYGIANDLGGYLAYKDLKDRASKFGIRLASDMVPNHTGVDSKWIREHPDWYVSLPYPPFPSYTYSGQDLCADPNVGVYIEDKYFSRSDAAVSFKRVDFNSGEEKYIYHGNDGTNMPWNDTAQLDFLKPEVREAVIQKIISVARMFPIIRFDAAMTLARKHIQRLWYPEPGSGGDIPSRAGLGLSKDEFIKLMPKEFWREVVDQVAEEVPGTLLLAEAFWLLEGFFVRTLGMHRVYNSVFMHALRDEENSLYRGSIKKALEFDRRMLKRFVNFMNNPDEETAIKQFGFGEKYFGVCLLLITMPGLPMFGHGQIEGYSEKYGMEYRRAYWDEEINEGLLHHHERTLFPIMQKRYIFAESDNFYLYDFWIGGHVNEDVYAYSNMAGSERGFVIYNNRYNNTAGFVKSSVGYNEEGEIKLKDLGLALDLPQEGYSIFRDYMTNLEYIRKNHEIQEKGLYFELDPFQGMCCIDWRLENDNAFFHYAQLCDILNGKGVQSIKDSLQELIYKPILTPFRELFNEKRIERFIAMDSSFIAVFAEIQDDIKSLLKEVQRYSNGGTHGDQILGIIKVRLHNLHEIYHIVIKSTEEHNGLKKVMPIFPQSTKEWGIYYAWVLNHYLGYYKHTKEYSMISRSWLDEWHFISIIQWVLTRTSSEQINVDEQLYLLKILVSHQDWDKKEIKEGVSSSYGYILPILSDPGVQNYLGFNRYQEKLWFNQERMVQLLHGLILIGLIKNLTNNSEKSKLLEIYQIWSQVVKDSNYQVELFLDKLKRS